MAPTTQNIPNTLLNGQQTFNFANTAQAYSWATVTIDRTVNGGLNSLTTADHLDISIDASPDGGTTWHNLAGITCVGGVLTTKGVTQTTETFQVGISNVGEGFRVNTNASTSVRIAGSIVYS